MTELRSVDPHILIPNPENPRRSPAPRAMDDQLLGSIRTIGIIQPPRVKQAGEKLVIIAGNRRVKAAIGAGLPQIDVLVCDGDETTDAMRSVSENLIRASMNSVDIWRATEALERQGWNEQAIADALALPVRTVKRLKLLAHLHAPMLDIMANGSAPMLDAALAGFGLTYLPEDQVQAYLADGQLVRVLADCCPPYPGYHLYYPSRRQPTPAFALLVEVLRFREGRGGSSEAPSPRPGRRRGH